MNFTKEQLDAINLDNTNIIVSAGAGSGKTAVLSERVIRKIKNNVHINELLILTFTNAAAKEMKDRIRNKLKKENMLGEIELLDSSYITTFDSYALSVLKKYHYLLNIDKDIKIIDNDLISYKKENILEDIFNEYYERNDELFNKLIYDFCTKDDEEIKKYILNISSKLDLIIDLDSYLDNYIDKYYSDEYLDSVIKDLDNALINKISNIKLLLDNLYYYVESDYFNKINEALIPLFNSNNYNDVRLNLNIKLPRLVTEEELAKNYKDKIKKEIDELKSICIYEDISKIKQSIINTKDYVKMIIDIIRKLNNRLFEFKYKNDLYEFSDISKLSIKLLRENEDIRNEIKESLNEIMIDEYQDTNDIQEEFISLISNDNVYMVGDIKQSIYRFRNANPYIFKTKYDMYSKNENGIKIDLNKNFRSREETLLNINKIFNLIMDDNIGGANYKESHQMVFGNISYKNEGKTTQNNNLEIYNYNYLDYLDYTKEEVEAFIIGNDILNKINNRYKVYDKNDGIRGCNYSDFVILLDRSKDFSLYKKVFEYLGIPLTILKDEKINDEIVLTIIKNFFVLISKIKSKTYDNEFRHAFVSILRSIIYEYKDEEIFDLFLDNSFYKNELFIKLSSKNFSSMTIKEVINYIIDEFNLVSCIMKIGNVENNLIILEYLLNYVDTKEDLGFTTTDFTIYLEHILEKDYDISFSSNKEDVSSVKIMTIHKSKGLEYSICYYAGLSSKFALKEIKDRFLFDNKYGIITPYFDEGINETIYKYLIKQNTLKEEISEKIRLFYVALTRAKEKMIIVSDLNTQELSSTRDGVVESAVRLQYRSFLDILISIKDELNPFIINTSNIPLTKEYKSIKKENFNSYIKDSDVILSVKELDYNYEMINESSFSKKQNSLLSKEEIKNMEYGTKVHSIFETEDFLSSDNEFIKKFKEKYEINNNPKVYKEYEFIFSENNDKFHGIIDLMFEYEDYIDIIDYKLKNINDELYIKQLNGYKNFIENKTSKTVNIYLYSILNNELKKIDL